MDTSTLLILSSIKNVEERIIVDSKMAVLQCKEAIGNL